MKILFDWYDEPALDDERVTNYYRKTASGQVVAKITYELDDVFRSDYCARIYNIDESIAPWYRSIPINYRFGQTIEEVKRWADKELLKLGYKLVSDKYKVLL